MEINDLNYVTAVSVLDFEDDSVDVIELVDGRVITIDGDRIALFESMAALHNSEVDDSERPSIPL